MVATRFAMHLLEGTHAARPAANAVPEGTLYSCSDHNLIYQSDTSSWTTWATLGGSPDLDAIITASSGQDIADALAGAAAPDAGNVFATMADVGGGGGALTYTSAQLSSPVTLNTSTFTDVLSLSLAAGTWLVMAAVSAETTAASVTGIEIKMWDGTNLFGSSDTVLTSGPGFRSPLVIIAPPIVLGTTTTVKISGKTVVAAGQISSSTVTATTAKASNLVAIKIV